MAQKVIRSIYEDGNVVLSNIRNNIGIPVFSPNDTFTASRVTTWYDGTPMQAGKADGKVYLRYKPTGEFFRVNLPGDGLNFLEKDTMTQMRALSSTEILLLRMGYYKGVKLNGYYIKGDTPAPIIYNLSNTSEEDDDGSVIEVDSVKLEYFGGINHVEYYGGVGDGVFYDDVAILKLLAKNKKLTLLEKNYHVHDLKFPTDCTIEGVSRQKSKFLISGQNQGITLNYNNTFRDISVQVSNDTFDGVAVKYAPQVLYPNRLTEPPRVIVQNVDIRFAKPSGAVTSNGIGVSMESHYGIGVYYCVFDNIEVSRAKVAFNVEALRAEPSQGVCWVNSNYITNSRAFGCQTVLKMRSEANTEIRNNEFNINFQNDLNFVTNAKVWDIPSNGQISRNIIEGTIWDLDAGFETGSLLGSIGQNKTTVHANSLYQTGSEIQFLGTLSASSASEVEIVLSRQTSAEQTIKIRGTSSAGIVIESTYASQDNLFENIYYKRIENDYYIYIQGLLPEFTYINFPRYNGFTPYLYNKSLSVIPGDFTLATRPVHRTYVSVQDDNILRGVATRMTSIATRNATLINNLDSGLNNIFGSNTTDAGIYYIDAQGSALGLPSSLYSVEVIKTGTRNSSESPNLGSMLIARGSNGLIYSSVFNGTTWSTWVNYRQVASTTVKGLVNQSTASADTATAPSAEYTQAEVQAILTELRDLKTKLRTAGILAT